mmetsp:Transcript_24210/g.57476  ORF Transcript_24210/g.57476 Transcript_24210/m.57476 type:complete len:665 (+) Transcript_24210:54-2048(+)
MIRCILGSTIIFISAAAVDHDRESESESESSNPCLLYLAESTIPGAGLGMFAGKDFNEGELVGRVGDPAFPTVDQDWHNSPEGASVTRHNWDYHWPLVNYDWNPPDIGMDEEGEDVSATVTGFGAAPNCHFRLLNVDEHGAVYDGAGLDRYTSPGAGAFTPWFNRSSTAANDIDAGSELFVDYGTNWFISREEDMGLVPVTESYEGAQSFLKEYGVLLVGSNHPNDLVEDKMALTDEAQKDLWQVIKTFPYASRARQALPADHNDAVKAIYGDIKSIEVENSIRPVDFLDKHGKCVDNIEPGISSIPHAGRGAFATRFIPKDGLVAPAPLVHIVDKNTVKLYNERLSDNGVQSKVVRDESEVIGQQLILNYCFGHPNSTVILFPYSSNVAYINHHPTEFNARLRWAKNFDFFHNEGWLNKSTDFLEENWRSGLMLEFVALRDINPGEEVLIDYGKEWQLAWEEHVKGWEPTSPEQDFNNLTHWTKQMDQPNGKDGYVRAEMLDQDRETPLRTVHEQKDDAYPHSVEVKCSVNANHRDAYLFFPRTIPFYTRDWDEEVDTGEHIADHLHSCRITERYEIHEDYEEELDFEEEDIEHGYMYTLEFEVRKEVGDEAFSERHEITNAPRKALSFANRDYTSDVFLKKAFRHEMILPDEVFPEAWKNLK